MKNILLIILFLFSSTLLGQDFDKQWKIVYQFELDGKIKSAHEEVRKIYKKAKQKDEETQIVKCFFYLSKFELVFDENASRTIIENLKKEIDQAKPISKAILNHIYATILDKYYYNNRYKINERTNLEVQKSIDFVTWTENDFIKEIEDAYSSSLKDELLLREISIVSYKNIFEISPYTDGKNYSLFDFLADNYITYKKSKIDHWQFSKSKGKDLFQGLYEDPKKFIDLKFETISEKNLKDILELYQKNEKYYLNKNAEKADWAYFNRILYISSLESDKKQYLKSASELEKNTSSIALKQELRNVRAQFYFNSASKESKVPYHQKALQLIDTIFRSNLNQNALAKAEALKNKILKKSLNISLETLLYPNQNTRAFVTFQNVDAITISVYRFPTKFNDWFSNSNYYDRKNKISDSLVLAFKNKSVPEKNYTRKLTEKSDNFEYSTEILLEKMDVGNYLIFIEADNDSIGTTSYTYDKIVVTNFAVVEENEAKNDIVSIYNRKTGEPLADIKINTENEYLITNTVGKVFIKKLKFEKDKKYSNTLYVIKGNDTLTQQYHRSFLYDEKKQKDQYDTFEAKAMVYFDRAIYRPGQKMYYKGILMQKIDHVKSVVPYTSIKVEIHDANSALLKEFDLQTNEFGSFSGEFEIPKNVLTGLFYIHIKEPEKLEKDSKYYDTEDEEHSFWDNVDFDEDYFNFQVEEYKRPTFEVKFDEIRENYTIGDFIKIKGNAKALAGNNLTNAKVSYTVSKTVTGSENYYINLTDFIIKEVYTDENGGFSIDFQAIEEGQNNESINNFTFHIKVSITDINGETRSAYQSVQIGKKTMLLDVELSRKMYIEEDNYLTINSTTLNNFPIDAVGEIKIYEIKNTIFRKNRVFGVPEIQSISRKDFTTLFPHEPYDEKENDTEKVLVKTLPFDTKLNRKIPLQFLTNKANYEIVVSTKDSKNNLITSESHFSLDSKKHPYLDGNLFWFRDISKPNAEHFEIEIHSNIPDLYINAAFYSDEDTIQEEKILQLHKGKAVFKFPKKTSLKNDVNFHFTTIWENFSRTKSYTIKKETIQQPLNIEVISMRNKMEPGSLENWSFKILNKKVEAEVLASMYDSSLDDITTEEWEDIYFYESNHFTNFPTIKINTISNNDILNFRSDSVYYINHILNPYLNWFGFDFNNPKNEYLRKKYLEKIESKARTPRNSKKIAGIVEENGLPLPGVNIVVLGTNRSTRTDFNGYYEIEAAENEQLAFTYIGFKSTIIRVKDSEYDIQMEIDTENLTVTVTTGYQTRKKSRTAAAINLINKEKLENVSLIQKLQGTVAGLNIATSTGQPGAGNSIILRGTGSLNANLEPLIVIDGMPVNLEDFRKLNQNEVESVSALRDAEATSLYGSRGANGVLIITTKKALKELLQVKTRTNFNETAFFFPHIKTDSKGQFSFNFTNPESLTRWKLRLYAHNKNTETGYFQSEIVSQKDIMVQTNMPRFVREKDTINISAKIVNMTNEVKSGTAMLLLFDATNLNLIDSISINSKNTRNFVCKPKESVPVNWTITIPEGLQGLHYKIVAKSGAFSDGEENILPVLSNTILINESIPIWVKGNSKKEYVFENLKNNASSTRKNHLFTLEYTSNPVWFALQSLPYLMEYEHECAEQTFSRYYGNFIAKELLNSNPKVAELFETWKNNPQSVSRLNLNDELKSIVLTETPWLLDAESDEIKNKHLALLMDLNTMKESMEKTFKKIAEKQMVSGGFPWFDGGKENTFITQHILAGLGHLSKMFPEKTKQFETITNKAIPFLDTNYIKNNSSQNTRAEYYAFSNLHFLYTRSFYAEKIPINAKVDSIMKLQKVAFNANWLHYSLFQKALLALTMHRFGDKDFAKKITMHLKETAARNDDNGMYWIENQNSYYWYQSAIETQALLIEAFTEIEKDKKLVDEMKVWLLKQKQTSHWPTTKATTEAIYALLLQGNDWTSIKDNTVFKIGDEKILTKKLASKEKEATTGYIKMNWKANEITNELATISVQNKTNVPGYGGAFWQYFEQLENIKTDSTSKLSITKNIFKKEKTTEGEKLVELSSDNIKTGDLITIRLIIKTENDLEFVHLKDLRASCFEPIDVISKYERRDNLNYYKSTKDVATHFFFDEIKKGTYILEYDVRVNNSGHFNNGISTLQSMYAPEFSGHSKSSSVKVN